MKLCKHCGCPLDEHWMHTFWMGCLFAMERKDER